jgi:nucleotide-binding universal stress UspA family protein
MAIGMAGRSILSNGSLANPLTNLRAASKVLARARAWPDISQTRGKQMRVYLVVIDESQEAHSALRFAARRAHDTNGAVHILALVPRQAFSAFGAVQATIEQEALDRAEVMANSAAGELIAQGEQMPQITVREGDGNAVINDYLREHPEVAALVLGAAAEGNPGPLVTHFSACAGSLPCPLFIVPGGLSDAEIDQVS